LNKVLVGLVLVALMVGAMMLFYQGENAMSETDTTDTMDKIAIPPIDAAAPQRTETATFALG
jgi:hypothetical protein